MLNSELHRALCAAAGAEPRDLHVVQCSSSSATGAIILHAWAGREPWPRLVVKTARNPRLPHALAHEWRALQALQREPALVPRIPAPLASFELDGATFYAYSGVPGRTMFAHYRNRPWIGRERMLRRLAGPALAAALLLHRSSNRAVDARDVAADLLRDLYWLRGSVRGFSADVADQARRAADALAAGPSALPAGRLHGDFSPYNLLLERLAPDAPAHVIDWEHTEPDRPQHLDLFRFVSNCLAMGRRGARAVPWPGQAADALRPLRECLLQPWLLAMGVERATEWLEREAFEALWWHYWIHAARREQERLARPTDLREARVLQGLMAHAAAR